MDAEDWKQYKEEKKDKKASNLTQALSSLAKYDVPYESKNNNIHLIIDSQYDYYPTTGLYINRDTKLKKRGLLNLLREIGVLNG